MKELSKILLSKKEVQLLAEDSFFHHKKNITEKIYHQLAACVTAIQEAPCFQKISYPPETDLVRGKITKGENYLGLPFIILDFPRLFSSEKIFAFRTMIWWGQHLSCTLVLDGSESQLAGKKLRENFSFLKKKETFLCINKSPWLHHFGTENFISLKSLQQKDADEFQLNQNFFKVARKIPVSSVNNMENFSAESFEIFSRLLL
ncbi:MAG: hypothetical protein ABIQ74_13075 [Chitinophagales bacterium]